MTSELFRSSTDGLASTDVEVASSTDVSLIIKPWHDWRLVATDFEKVGLDVNDVTLPAPARTKRRAAALLLTIMVAYSFSLQEGDG
mmetsp:Transcript_1649/g.2641  ORF Transcript_1649/g.2641 Transcript_1649/m.2641 type:complete len:86 (-) Transcript_1649:90-347(-)